MTERTEQTEQTAQTAPGTHQDVARSITVRAAPERAFEVFTTGMTGWWNPDYTIGSEPYEAVVVEPREGGRWYERAPGGAECDWGRVRVWDPPARLVLTWQISADWAFDPDLVTELEITFTPQAGGTRVDLVHRGLEAYGDRAPELVGVFAAPDGWAGLLERLAAAV